MIHKVEIETNQCDEMIDVTSQLTRILQKEDISEGIMIVTSLHTTAGITVNENADPDVKHDMLMRLNEIYPWEHQEYQHIEGNSAAHLKTSTVGTSHTVFIANGELVLGTWQGVYFCEFDGPRRRTFAVKIIRS